MQELAYLTAAKAFDAAARHLSFVRASEELGVTPAAVGQQVRSLEAWLGVQLFHRSRSGPARLILTEEGRAAAPEFHAGFERIRDAMRRLKTLTGRRTLTVSVTPAFAARWLLPRLERFQDANPELDVRLDTSERPVDYAAHGIDVGVRYGPGKWPGLSATLLATETVFPVCSPVLASGAVPLRISADLHRHILIHDVAVPAGARIPDWRTWLTEAGVSGLDPDRGLRINSSSAVVQAAAAGQGVALGRSLLVADDLAAGRLVRLFPDAREFQSSWAYYIVHRPETAMASQSFREWMLTDFAREQPELAKTAVRR